MHSLYRLQTIIQILVTSVILLVKCSFSAHMPRNYYATTYEQRKQMMKAVQVGDLATVNQLLADGYHSESGDLFRITPLIHAAAHNNEKIIRRLIAHGAKLDWPDEFGVTPFLAAVMFKNFDMAQLLLQHGAKPLLKKELKQIIDRLWSQYYCGLAPKNFILTYTLDQSSTQNNIPIATQQYAIAPADLDYYLGNIDSLHCTHSEIIDSREKRFQQYIADMWLVVEREFWRTRRMFVTLEKELPSVPCDLLYLIISFESDFLLQSMYSKHAKLINAIEAIQKSIYYAPTNAITQSLLLHGISQLLSPAATQFYLEQAKEEIQKTTQRYLHLLQTSGNIEAKELKNPLNYLKRRVDKALQKIRAEITGTAGALADFEELELASTASEEETAIATQPLSE